MTLDAIKKRLANATPGRMDAYYYQFQKTGCGQIDKILSAIATAGKAFHHTDQWNDDVDKRWAGNHEGKTPIEWIQNAGNAAAVDIAKLIKVAEAARDALPLVSGPNKYDRLREALEKL